MFLADGFGWCLGGVEDWWFLGGSLSFCEGALRFLRGAWAFTNGPYGVAAFLLS